MTTFVPIPPHGIKLVDEDGRAKSAFQLFLDAVGLNFSTGRANLIGYTVADVPNAAAGYGLIMVTDEVGGPVTAFSDLTNWRRTTDRAVIS